RYAFVYEPSCLFFESCAYLLLRTLCAAVLLELPSVACDVAPSYALDRLRLTGLRQIVERRLRAARVMRHAGFLQSHFHTGQRAAQRQIVEIAQVADAENL